MASIKQFPLEEEYKKPTKVTPQDISVLREWLKTQPHLPAEHITDLDLILIYHSCSRSTEVAKQVIDNYFSLRTLFPTFFKDRVVDSRIEQALGSQLPLPLPTRTRDGNAILYMKFLDSDPKNYFVPDVIRATIMVLDLWQYEEGTWPGFVIALDMEGSSVGHLTRWDLQTIQQISYYLREAMIVSFKGFHFVNAPNFMDRMMTLMKPFLKQSVIDTLQIHQPGAKSLDKIIPIEDLPKESGGKYKSYKECKEDVLKKLRAGQEYFENESKKRVVEARRPGKPKTLTDLFGGVEGSFKKLDID